MGRSKSGPALIELMKTGSETPPATEEGDRLEEGHPPGAPSASEPAPQTSSVRSLSSEEVFCEVLDGRVRFSFTQGSATLTVAILAAVLVLACVVSYRWGRNRGWERGHQASQAAVEDKITQRERTAPVGGLYDGIGKDPTHPVTEVAGGGVPSGPAATVAKRYEETDEPCIPGNNYIVVQDFKADARDDALRVWEYLADRSIPTVLRELTQAGPYKYRLITVSGFNLDDQVQATLAEEYLEKVRQIGREYYANGGRYDFRTAYKKKLTAADCW